MKECFGNYMRYPTCKGHHDCKEAGCFSKTNIDKGVCDCPYKASCHVSRQYLQKRFREEDSDYKVEDCDFY
jgi:hypothetical protein